VASTAPAPGYKKCKPERAQAVLMSVTIMSDAQKREIAEALFEQNQSREEIKDAIKLEEARRAAIVENLYRLRSLRLSRNQSSRPNAKST
jgi:hypothetical protein